MTSQVSPGIRVSEIDNTNVAPAIATTIGAFVGNFRWGPVNEVATVSNETELVAKFAAPNDTNSVDFHTAAQFLRYANNLKVVRQITSAAFNANAGGHATTLVRGLDHYNSQTFTFSNQGNWIAKYPGALGNSLKVAIKAYSGSSNQTDFDNWAYASRFDGPPTTSAYVSDRNGSNDEVHIVVIDEDGLFTGTPNTILETFSYLSQASDAKTSDGASNYYADVINAKSKYIWFGAHNSTAFTNAGSSAASTDFEAADADGIVESSLSAGVDSAALTASEFATGWDNFNDSIEEAYLLICPDLPSGSESTIVNDIAAIAIARQDCVAFASPEKSDQTAAAIKAFADSLTATSYLVVDSGRLKVFDKYNNKLINIPACSSVAGLCAKVDYYKGAWFSPADFDYNQILGIDKLYFNPTDTDSDTLYKAGVNPIRTFPGQGTLLYGDKTHLNRPSAFDRINVRRLFNLLKVVLKDASRSALFKFNDEFTRSQFVSLVDPFLEDIKGRRGITDKKVVCDATNNTPQIVDTNSFVADIYIKPARTINFIQLNFIATRTGFEFNEIVVG